MKRCYDCGLDKTPSEFGKNNSRSDGLQHRCKECQSKGYKKSKAERPEKWTYEYSRWNSKLLATFGITSAEYDTILSKQNGVCAICGESETSLYRGKVRRLAVDHDHITGKVRALLCNHCNTGLGKFKEDPTLLQSAIYYLRNMNANHFRP